MGEVELQRVLKPTSSDCRSLGSNNYPSVRFPKVSIGIAVEKCPKTFSGTGVLLNVAMPTTSGRDLSQGKTPEENRILGTIKDTEEISTKPKEQNTSPWFSTRSIHYETSGAETVQVVGNQASVVQLGDGVYKKLDTFSFRKRREADGNIEQAEKVTFNTVQEMRIREGDKSREHPIVRTDHKNKALKMKLWEILGAGSQNKQTGNLPDLEETRTLYDNCQREVSPKVVPPDEQNDGKLADLEDTRTLNENNISKGKLPNSDPIETDSSLNQVKMRPVTHSQTRNKVPPAKVLKLQHKTPGGKKPLPSFSSDSKKKQEQKNIFAFDDGGGKLSNVGRTASGTSNSSKWKIENKKAKVEPRRIHFPRKSPSGNRLQYTEREQEQLVPDKASLQNKETGRSPSLPDQFETPKEVNGNTHSLRRVHECSTSHNYVGSPFLKKKTQSRENEVSMAGRNNALHQEKVSNPGVPNYNDIRDDLQSPTFAMNASASPQKSELPDEDFCSPSLPKSLDCSGTGSYASDGNKESSNDTHETHESQEVIPQHFEEEKESGKKPFGTSIEDQMTRSAEGKDYFSNGYSRPEKLFLDSENCKSTPTFLRKQGHSLKNEKASRTNISSPSLVVTSRTEETALLDKASKQFPENSLQRAVYQLALVLERFKTKIKSHTDKKSSEILLAAAEKVQLELQDADSNMEADVEKFVSFGKSKRKRLELKFQEQQEKLKTIHAKFKEEVNQHLVDCRNALEEFEAHQIELKGNAEKLKALHRKLLLNVEEAIEAQLGEAETRVADIRMEARKKMKVLKHVLKEWIMEGES
ncbi:meiosis-specific protein PAIR3 [Ananas comosus]|uniref:Meiosis-specific protein PAIR3 n=1 Tax=Ananas comosus TaxID=4615 RepID=A0A6P5GE88_ANACO|nr:meiosis-specific protein PAIR3 [Ananas comosus]